MTQAPPTEAPRLLTVAQACEQLGLGKVKVYELMDAGELAYIKLPPGTKQAGRRIEQAAIEAFLERNRHGGTTP